jgi:hypothetical protein
MLRGIRLRNENLGAWYESLAEHQDLCVYLADYVSAYYPLKYVPGP